MTLQAIDDLRAIAKKLDKPATPRTETGTLAPTELRKVIQRSRDRIKAKASISEWAAAVEPGAEVPQQGATFWHLEGANRSTTQILPDTFAVGLSTQVTEGEPFAVLKL